MVVAYMSSKSVSVYLFGSPSPIAKLDLTCVVNVGALLATHGSYFFSLQEVLLQVCTLLLTGCQLLVQLLKLPLPGLNNMIFLQSYLSKLLYLFLFCSYYCIHVLDTTITDLQPLSEVLNLFITFLLLLLQFSDLSLPVLMITCGILC